MKILYFAWLRERIGAASEEVDPQGLETVRDLVSRLSAQDEGHQAAFEDMTAVRVAVDQKVTTMDASITGAREIAFFPPMTGG